MVIKKQTSIGTLSLLLLRLLSNEDMYGYKIIEELYEQSNYAFDLKAGSLYPLLHTLEKEGFVSSYNTEVAGKRIRKYYHLTEMGRKELVSREKEWHSYVNAVNLVLGRECDATY